MSLTNSSLKRGLNGSLVVVVSISSRKKAHFIDLRWVKRSATDTNGTFPTSFEI